MISMLRQMLTCHWSARRIQRYLDQDRSAPLSADEVARLERHLAVCEKCAALADDHRALRRRLAAWSTSAGPDPAAIARLRSSIDAIVAEEG